jgi:hypothetical protein
LEAEMRKKQRDEAKPTWLSTVKELKEVCREEGLKISDGEMGQIAAQLWLVAAIEALGEQKAESANDPRN